MLGVIFVRGPPGTPRGGPARANKKYSKPVTGDLSTPLARWSGKFPCACHRGPHLSSKGYSLIVLLPATGFSQGFSQGFSRRFAYFPLPAARLLGPWRGHDLAHWLPANRPFNQPAHQPPSQSTNWRTNQLSNQSTSGPADEPTTRPAHLPSIQPTNESTNKTTNQPLSILKMSHTAVPGGKNDQPISQLANQHTS